MGRFVFAERSPKDASRRFSAHGPGVMQRPEVHATVPAACSPDMLPALCAMRLGPGKERSSFFPLLTPTSTRCSSLLQGTALLRKRSISWSLQLGERRSRAPRTPPILLHLLAAHHDQERCGRSTPPTPSRISSTKHHLQRRCPEHTTHAHRW